MIIESSTGIYHDERDRAKGNVGYHFVSVMALFLILLVEISYRENLFNSSLDFIAGIQAGSSEAKKAIWKMYSDIGISSAVGIPPFAMFLIFWDRLAAFSMTAYLTAMLFLMNVTKQFYHE